MRYYFAGANNQVEIPEAFTTIRSLEMTQLNLALLPNADADGVARGYAATTKRRPLRLLLSYHYFKDVDLDAFMQKFPGPTPELFIDSGGFSAFTQGVDISIEEYAAFLRRWSHLIKVSAVLDAIGNPVKTWENQKRMEDMGLAPIPCFHTGEDMKWLERYIEGYPYIAIGGMVPYLRIPQRLMPWLIHCFQAARGRSVFHGFGATSWKIASVLPWYSVDSSSWASSVRYGQVDLFNPKTGKFEHLTMGDPTGWRKNAALIRSLGFDPEMFARHPKGAPITGEFRQVLLGLCAMSYINAEGWLRQRHGEIVIPARAQGATV